MRGSVLGRKVETKTREVVLATSPTRLLLGRSLDYFYSWNDRHRERSRDEQFPSIRGGDRGVSGLTQEYRLGHI